jgi:hypothetical protein
LIFGSLTEAQKQAASGRISDPNFLVDDDIARATTYFTPDMPANICKITLATSKAILLLDDPTFKVLSCPVLAFDRDNEEIFIGHEGNSTLYPTPISIFARVATADVKVLVNDRPDDVDDSVSALHDFLVDHPVTATPMIANENAGANKNAEGDEDQQMAAFPFLPQITDPATTFANHYVAGLPAVIPLPPGHDLNSVDLRYEDAFVARLSEIGPHFYKWAAAMYKADNWWEGCSLNVKALAILPVFSHGLFGDQPFPEYYLHSVVHCPSDINRWERTPPPHQPHQIDNIDHWFDAMHNSLVHLHKMAMDPTWTRAVLQQDEVPANTILFLPVRPCQCHQQLAEGGVRR